MALALLLEGRYFNPDDYLETESGRVFTPERSAAAFERAYTELERALRSAPSGARLFVVVELCSEFAAEEIPMNQRSFVEGQSWI
jgi:hypothetical protein